jgi:hypothetical protein
MWYPLKPKEGHVPVARRTVRERLAAAWHAAWHGGFGNNHDVVDVDYIRARVDHWTARHAADKYGRFASVDALGPYHVVREGDRIVVTPPKSPLHQSESWVFSPGRAELTVRRLFARQPTMSSRAVDRIWISHRVWTNGKGASDALRIRGRGFGSETVVDLEYNLVHNVMRPPGRGFGWSVSPTLDDPAADDGTPQGISEDPDPTLVAPVAPTILALSRVIAETTGRPVCTYVEFITQPRYTGDGPGD